jgi:hypothetical protein
MFETYRNADASLLIRTDFSDDAKWESLCGKAKQAEPADGFTASFICVNDKQLANMVPAAIAKLAKEGLGARAVFIADTAALAGEEHAILCVDASDASGTFFRVIASELWGPENNLRLGNMDFIDFVRAVDTDGVFRGFK